LKISKEITDMNDLRWNYARPAMAMFGTMDQIRRHRGELLDFAGFGPIETPYRILHSEAGVNLRRYGEASHQGPALLIVPAPIKRAYIWDLAPQTSVVRHCLEKGMRVYLAEWTPAADAEQDFGLADYGDRLLKACVAAIQSDSGEAEVVLAGHSLGGILAAMFACLHPRHARAVLLLEAPLHFAADAGNFAPMVAATPDSRPIEKAFGNVPGSFLNVVSAVAAPHVFQWQRYLDWSLSMTSPEAFRTHMRVERWTHDEFPLPGRLFTEIVELLYRNDQLMNGSLWIGDRQIGPRDMKAPLLNVIDPRSTIIPPQSILPFHEAAASRSKKVLRYEGDVGVGLQHVGVLVGASAHAVIWPAIFDWLAEVGIAE
jgi:polyhydroxyalkanoate synthase